jgi:putative sterol carrier protein
LSEEDDINEEKIAGNVAEDAAKEKKVTIKHVFEDHRGLPQEMIDNAEDTEKLKEKLQEREAQLAALALKHFNDRKEAVLEKISEEKREKADLFIGENPNNLKLLEFQYGI